MECCGEPFQVGDSVRWTATKARPKVSQSLSDVAPSGVDWIEEHHGAEQETIEGTVTRIQALWEDLQLDPLRQVRVTIDGSGVTEELTSVAPPDIDVDEVDPHPDKSFQGYIVTLDR